MTTGQPGLMMPAFSAAISSTRSPRKASWSSEIGMMTETAGFSITLVASKRPPSPTSTIAASAGFSENSTNMAAVRISNTVMVSPRLASATRRTASASTSSETSEPPPGAPMR